MAEHAWVVETYDAGPMGESSSWRCPDCGLCGGPYFGSGSRRWAPFLSGEGTRVSFSEDCDEARAQIAALKASPEWQAKTRERRINDALGILAVLSPRVGGKVDRKSCRVNGGDGKRKFEVELLGIEGPWKLTMKSNGDTKEFAEVFDVIEYLRDYFKIPRRYTCVE